MDGAEAANAARWAAMAKAAIAEVRAQGRVPMLVGGTGLYLSTLLNGIAPVPDIAPDVRDAVRGLETADAAAALAREDPALAARLNPADRQRLLRGLEVVRGTGRSLLAWQAELSGGIGAEHDVRAVVTDVPRPLLNARAEARLWQMLGEGVLAEVAALLARQLPADRPVLRALGVAEFGVLPGDSPTTPGRPDVADAVAQVAAATRRYQKRQTTWARNQVPDWMRKPLWQHSGAPEQGNLCSIAQI
jgi:tRNA dimethylallyltransferase